MRGATFIDEMMNLLLWPAGSLCTKERTMELLHNPCMSGIASLQLMRVWQWKLRTIHNHHLNLVQPGSSNTTCARLLLAFAVGHRVPFLTWFPKP
ncbi:hypothetical protein M378DRAFT_850147 [Amanita muscaria Koide BX008]|uniref:Uncharacterized protein n=1 Tax=Amanita muscaria (strain Koide BX008) TaxID=946122 RepID=A0A0C2WXM8_AMAMK|nr:hypothetical protein M378DRAFT_850147 [Amanita muscaria Koide BX008]